MARMLANNDEKRQQSTIKVTGYFIVFIAVVCCELLLDIRFSQFVMRRPGVRFLFPAPA
jgi:hypothetical protein